MAELQCLVFCLAIMLCFIGIHSKTERRLILDNEPTLDIGGEISQLKATVQALQTELEVQKNATMETKRDMESQRQTMESQRQTMESQRQDLELQKSKTALLEAAVQANSNGLGSVYVRWGRTVCPPAASLLYKGYTAGKFYAHKGSGTDNLCLPEHPTWSNYNDSTSGARAYIYGTEIDTDDNQHIFNYPVDQQDLPCAVCTTNRSTSLMIPARNNCYNDWHFEYHGYLMAAHFTDEGFDHICVDDRPEFVPHGGTNDDQHILHIVEGHCGSLPCPPYVDGRELACVVCSK